MSVAVGPIWPSLFHGSEGKKQKRPTTSQQGTSSKHWLLPFQLWEWRLLWLQSVAWLFHKLEGFFHKAAPTCTRRHIASWTWVQLTSEAHWQLNLQKNRWWAACRWWRISKNFITKKNILKWPNSLSKSSGRGDNPTNTTGWFCSLFNQFFGSWCSSFNVVRICIVLVLHCQTIQAASRQFNGKFDGAGLHGH